MGTILKTSAFFMLSIILINAQSSDGKNGLLSQADSLTLQEVVITANKVPAPISNSIQPVQLITRAEIEANPGKDLAQILNELAGVSINGSQSNPGKNKEVFVRGANSDYTLILVDGMPVYDAAGIGGAFDLRLIPPDQIERVEVVKGSQSVLYGSDAIAGVIHIITRANTEATAKLKGHFNQGTLNTHEGGLEWSTQYDEFGFHLSYDRFYNEGMSEALSPSDTSIFDNDPLARHGAQFKIKYKPGSFLSISPVLRYNYIEGGYDDGAFADAANRYESEWWNHGVNLQYESGGLNVRGLYSYTHTDREFNSSFGTSLFAGRTQQFDLFGSYQFTPRISLLSGIYYRKAKSLDELATEPNPSFNSITPYIQAILTDFIQWNVQIGLRINHHSAYGLHDVISLAISRKLFGETGIFASYSTGFKSPSLDQLYGQFGPNPDLEPQVSRTFEFGLRSGNPIRDFACTLTYFKRKIDQVIIYDFTSGYQNLHQQNDEGIEWEGELNLSERIRLKTGYLFLTGEVTVPLGGGRDSSYNNLVRKPKHEFSLSLFAQTTDNLLCKVSGRYVGNRMDLFFNNQTFQSESRELDGYFLTGLQLEYRVPVRQISVYADLQNILDAQFTESVGFSTLGRHLMVGVRFCIP